MKHLTVIAVLMLIATAAIAQEPVPPERPTVVYEYHWRWSEGIWESLSEVVMTEAMEPPPTVHSFTGILGTQIFKAQKNVADTGATVPVVRITFDLAALPEDDNWDFGYFRWGKRWSNETTGQTRWAEAFWVEFKLMEVPGQPIHTGN